MDFMLIYVETFCLGKVTDASLSGLELPGLDDLMIRVYSLEKLGFSEIKKGSFQNFIFVYTVSIQISGKSTDEKRRCDQLLWIGRRYQIFQLRLAI